MFLLDSNCWMQIARKREHDAEVRQLRVSVPRNMLFITDFAVHSLAIVFRRFDALPTFPVFLEDTGIGKEIGIVRNPVNHWPRIAEVAVRSQLDVEDAYQFVAAESNQLRLVSLDSDFDRVPGGRLTPAAALSHFLTVHPNPK